MFCIHNGKSCVMVYDVEAGKYVYIPERKWDKLTKVEKVTKYRLTHSMEMSDFEIALMCVK